MDRLKKYDYLLLARNIVITQNNKKYDYLLLARIIVITKNNKKYDYLFTQTVILCVIAKFPQSWLVLGQVNI